MTKQLEIDFTRKASEVEKKNEVLKEFETKYPGFLDRARAKARHYCRTNHGNIKYGIPYSVTMDDVRELLDIQTASGTKANNVHGAVFKTKEFKWTGQFYHSKTENSHARIIRIWQLKECINE